VKVIVLVSPIWVGFLLGIFFPFYGLQSSYLAMYLLLTLGLLNTLPFDFKKVKLELNEIKKVSYYLFIGYFLLPSIQMFLAYFFIEDRFIQLGILMASLAPVAMVVPQFLKAEEEKHNDIDLVFSIY
jgi:hypothetical protein